MDSENIEIGGNIGKSGTFAPTIGYNESKRYNEEQEIGYSPTVINGDYITIKAGGNIHIKGSQIAGKKINIEAKKNLTIESNQESYTYKNKNAGIGINVGVKTVSGEITKGKINYKVDTVTEQAGIYAGDEGFTINVGEATNLKGAIIDSRAKDENKNTLTTNSLHTENIINEETLNNQDIGAGYHEGEGTKRNEEKLTPMIPISIDKNKKSITYAGIQKGKLIIKGNQNYSVDKVNRNTQDTLNALENTLDLKDIEEKKRLSELFAKYANGYVHDISKEKGWKEGSEEKVILHAIIGGITAKIGNGNYQAGAFSGAVNEFMNGAIAKYEAKTGKPIDPATHQWLSVAVGAIVNQAAGMSMQTGAAEAVYGTKWNYLTALPPENILKKFVKEETISDQSISEKEIQQILKALYSAWNDMYNPSNKDIQFDLNSVQEGVFIDSLKAQGINDKASREILKRCKQYAIRQFIHSFNVYRLPEVFVNARRQSFNVAHVLSANSADAIYMIWIPAGTKISSETKETGKYRVGHAVIVQGGKAIGFGPYNGNIGKSQNGGVHVEDARYIMDLVSQGKATIRDVKYGYEAEKTGKRINSFIYKHHVHIKEGDITLITLDRSSGYQKYGGKAWLFSNNCINFANDLFEPSHPMPTYLEFGYGPGKYIDYSDEYSHKPD